MHSLSDFRPPLPNPLIIKLCQFIFPLYTRLVDPLKIEFCGTDFEALKFLNYQPTVIMLNHPDKQDPLILIAISKFLRSSFYCIVAREVFDWKHGWLGWLFQRLGCYSVDRGTTDFKSIQTTLKILCRENRKLIVFPEGEVTADEDLVQRINPALMHVLLKAQAEVAKNDLTKTIWMLPVGVNYRLQSSLEKSIGRTVKIIEQKLNKPHERYRNIEERVDTAVRCTLDRLAAHYNFLRPKECSIADEVELLAQHICDRLSVFIFESKPETDSLEQLLHRLRTQLNKKLDGTRQAPAYDRSLQNAAVRIYREFIADLDRVERLVIFQRVLSRHDSPIRTCRIVDFLESELCGRMTPKGRQVVSIYLGKPFDLRSAHYERLGSNHLAAERLSEDVRDELQTALVQARAKSI